MRPSAIPSLRKADVDLAYRSAAAAQKIWAQVNPFEKRAILEKAITFVEANEAEITDILIEERGGTGFKAFFEIGIVKNIIKESATYPLRMNGEILPSTVDGKEDRLSRVPVGVVGVIRPFNAPLFLSMRSVATALGAGNGVVPKPHDDSPITGGTLVARVFEEAGLPQGLLNVVVADVQAPPGGRSSTPPRSRQSGAACRHVVARQTRGRGPARRPRRTSRGRRARPSSLMRVIRARRGASSSGTPGSRTIRPWPTPSPPASSIGRRSLKTCSSTWH
jgi:hypothetical protein